MNRESFMLHTLQSTSNPILEEIARPGAERMLAMALEAEIQAFIEQYFSIKNAQGKVAVIRNGYLPDLLFPQKSDKTIPVHLPSNDDIGQQVVIT